MDGSRGSLPHRLVLSAVAASCAEATTYPLDFLKTRLQLHRSRTPQGLFTTATTVLRQEGVRGFYAGISAAVIRHIPYTGLRVATFETLRNWNFGATKGEPISLPSLLVFGFVSGGLGQLAAVPADVVKIRMQADGRRFLTATGGGERRYRGVLDAFSKIVRQEGVRGLWWGSFPAVQRAALVNLGELSTYDYAKRAIVQSKITGGDNIGAHVLSAMCSGLCSSLISTPADVIKTRMMEQDSARPVYRGALDCLGKAWRDEGLRGLYKGFLPTWARLGPWQLTFWVTFEQLRHLGGLQGF